MDISYGLGTASRGLGLGTAQAAQIMKEIGFDGVDFGFCEFGSVAFGGTDAAKELYLQRYADVEKAGLKVCQSHLHYLPGHIWGEGLYQKFEDEYLPAYINSIETCGEIGCPVAVIHLYFEDSKEATFNGNVALISKLLPYLEKNNVKLAIENIFKGGDEGPLRYSDCHITLADDIMEYVDKLNHPLVGVCLDTGHAVATNQNVFEMIKKYGKHLVALHMNSNAGRDMHLLPGTLASWLDPNDYGEVSRALKEIGYSGAYNLEIGCGENWPNKPMSGVYYLQLVYAVASGYARLAE